MPKITFHGPSWYARLKDGSEIYRGDTREVSQEWVNKYRAHLTKNKSISVVGDEGITVDAGNDGLPDEGWTKKDITGWLKEKGVSITGYATKAKLLDKVKTTLNPPAPKPVVEEVAPEPVATEKSKGKPTIVKTEGDE
mgnify:FL=1